MSAGVARKRRATGPPSRVACMCQGGVPLIYARPCRRRGPRCLLVRFRSAGCRPRLVGAKFCSWPCLPLLQGGSKVWMNLSSRLFHCMRSAATCSHSGPAIVTMWRSVSRLLLNLLAWRAPMHPLWHGLLLPPPPHPPSAQHIERGLLCSGNVPPHPPDHAEHMCGPSVLFVLAQMHPCHAECPCVPIRPRLPRRACSPYHGPHLLQL